MGMAVTVQVDQVMDAMVARLRQERAPAIGASTTVDRYLRHCDRYAGQLNGEPDKVLSAFAGRAPAMLVAFAGEELVRTTVGRRVDKVLGTYVVACISDVHRTEADRKDVYTLLHDARTALASKSLGLPMGELQPGKVLTMLEHPQLVCYGQTFTSRYRVNHTRMPPYDVLASADTKVLEGKTAFNPPVAPPTVAVVGTPGATTLAYKIVAIDAEGRRTLSSAAGSSSAAPGVLSGADFARVTWAAVPGAVLYEVYRTVAGGTPNSVGKIATLSLLTLDDTGLAADGQLPIDPVHLVRTRAF